MQLNAAKCFIYMLFSKELHRVQQVFCESLHVVPLKKKMEGCKFWNWRLLWRTYVVAQNLQKDIENIGWSCLPFRLVLFIRIQSEFQKGNVYINELILCFNILQCQHSVFLLWSHYLRTLNQHKWTFYRKPNSDQINQTQNQHVNYCDFL